MARKTQEELLAADKLRNERLELKLKATQIKAALSYYGSAGVGRQNKDWRASPVSADAAIIPDGLITCARARDMVANSSLGKAAVRAQKRNVVGRGITVIPVATAPDGKTELTELNKVAYRAFSKWAGSVLCDVERKRTYWQMQRMTVGEEFITGMSLMVWTYEPQPDRVGLGLQMFEYEQLNRNIMSFAVTAPDGTVVSNNQVRGGVEIDGNGAPVAYHFFKRNPNDFAYRANYEPIRVDARRVFAYFDAERVHQSVGISQFAPVLQDMRRTLRINSATLDRVYMESCIGMAIKQPLPQLGGAPVGLPRQAGDTGTTATGMRTIDFVPGMVPILNPGEEITSLVPTSPGNMYSPFTETMQRNIGAGLGQSYGALTRHNDANYSAARQDMLEDEREIEPQQDALVDLQIRPVYELFYTLAVFEGRLPVDEAEFASDRDRFLEAEYIPPERPWIDPEKEVNAYEKAIQLRLTTRKRIVAMTGDRFSNVLQQIKHEQDEAKALDIEFPEDAEIKAAQAPAPAKLPEVAAPAGKTKQGRLSQADAPNYQPLNDPLLNCANCRYYQGGVCGAYDFPATPTSVCDSFEAAPLTADKGKLLPQFRPDGTRGIDRQPDPAASTAPPL